jgi:hypothetical protein
MYWHREGPTEVRECLFKVSWTRVEPNLVGRGLPRRRRVTMGTTLAIDWKTRTIRARLTSDAGAVQREDRDRLLGILVDAGILRLGDEACAANGSPLHGAVRADVIGGVLRIRNAARMLHLHPEGAA